MGGRRFREGGVCLDRDRGRCWANLLAPVEYSHVVSHYIYFLYYSPAMPEILLLPSGSSQAESQVCTSKSFELLRIFLRQSM